jgi:hypothetical protein
MSLTLYHSGNFTPPAHIEDADNASVDESQLRGIKWLPRTAMRNENTKTAYSQLRLLQGLSLKTAGLST